MSDDICFHSESNLFHTGDCTWYDGQRFVDPNDRRLASRYVTCLYWSVSELMSVPYGDILPTSLFERQFFTLMHFLAGMMNAYLIGGIVGIMAALGAKNARFFARMDHLNDFIRSKNVNVDQPQLAAELRRYYLFRERHGGEDTEGYNKLLNDVSPWFKGQIANCVHGAWLAKISYFHGHDPITGLYWEIDDFFRVALATHIRSRVYAPGEAVIQQTDPCTELFVVSKGLVGCRSNRKWICGRR